MSRQKQSNKFAAFALGFHYLCCTKIVKASAELPIKCRRFCLRFVLSLPMAIQDRMRIDKSRKLVSDFRCHEGI